MFSRSHFKYLCLKKKIKSVGYYYQPGHVCNYTNNSAGNWKKRGVCN